MQTMHTHGSLGSRLVHRCSICEATGVLVVPAGPKVVRFVPPLIISENDVNVAMERFESAIKKILTTL